MHNGIDILLIEARDAEAREVCAVIKETMPDASFVRVTCAEQALRLMFHQGLFTKAPQRPRLLLCSSDALLRRDPLFERVRRESAEAAIPMYAFATNVTAMPIEIRAKVGELLSGTGEWSNGSPPVGSRNWPVN